MIWAFLGGMFVGSVLTVLGSVMVVSGRSDKDWWE